MGSCAGQEALPLLQGTSNFFPYKLKFKMDFDLRTMAICTFFCGWKRFGLSMDYDFRSPSLEYKMCFFIILLCIFVKCIYLYTYKILLCIFIFILFIYEILNTVSCHCHFSFINMKNNINVFIQHNFDL
jgi:hypothetical protein